MANDLTGQFDAVVEFSVGAVNRLLAAMHRSERFLHSVTFRVDDVPRPFNTVTVQPSVLASRDAFGDPTANQDQVGRPIPVSGPLPARIPLLSVVDTVVNLNIAGATTAVQPSFLKGVAQLQLSPPELFLSPHTGSKVTVSMQIMSRYLPDPETTPLREFIRGQIRISADVSQVASKFPNAQNMIHVDIEADTVGIDFIPQFPQDMSDVDIATVVLAIRNALKTSALPTNVTVPDNVISIQFKTLPGSPQAIAMLLNLDLGFAHGGTDPASVTRIFLGAADDFAFAAGRDYVMGVFQPIIDTIKGTSFQPVEIKVTVPVLVTEITVIDATYTPSLTSVSADLRPGKIVVTIEGNAHTSSAVPGSFEFTVEQELSLSPHGDAADLVVGGISITDIRKNSLVSAFKGHLQGYAQQLRDQMLDAQPPGGGPTLRETLNATVRQTLSGQNNLGGFLTSLLAPTGTTTVPSPEFQVACTSIDIQPSGIVLHGSLAVADWPPPYVEFEAIPATTRRTVVVPRGPDYSALKTWIPGGRITEYDWFFQGQAASPDTNKFVRLDPGEQTLASAADVSGTVVHPSGFTTGPAYAPLCLTVRGTRLTTSGPPAVQPVSASTCGYTTTSILNAIMVSANGSLPLVALAEPGPGGVVHVAGHMQAQVGAATPNRIVHFADGNSLAHLEFLTQALQESKRGDAGTAILAVLTPEQLAKAPYREGIIYLEDQDGSWERVFRAASTQRPSTLILDPSGKEVWRHEGQLDHTTLSAALVKLLVRGGSAGLDVLRSSLRLGQLSPNFLIPYAPGRELTLRRLAGPVVLAFWRAALESSIQMVRDLVEPASQAAGRGPVFLAINDGDSADVARRVAAENRFADALVIDPEREISAAYGVKIWPMIVSLDTRGLVQEVRFGRRSARIPPPRRRRSP